jgi:hypothetical protein
MTLKERFRQELTGHLSDEKTEVDVNIATRIAEEFAIGFADWLNSVSYRSFDGNWYLTQIDEDIKKTTEELLEIYEKEKGL